jgi:hypothetical protein
MRPKLNINESFICRIWEDNSYYTGLQTTDGKDVEIISYGKRNNDSGPDYKDAKVKIDGKTYSGDIEIHRDFKNWAEHNHPKDRKYNPVILHVVLWDSEERISPKLRIKRNLPTVILANHLKYSIHSIWQDIINKPSGNLEIPCYKLNDSVSDTILAGWLEKLSSDRLNLKTARIKGRLAEISKENAGITDKLLWEQVLYEFIFEALGFSKNKEQMINLAKSLNLNLLKKLTLSDKSLVYLQSILFGTGGFLFDLRLKDDYISKIKTGWKDVEKKITSQKLNLSDWNFFRLRPQNFPTIRIAYGSQVIFKLLYRDLFKNIIMIFKNKNFKTNDCYESLTDLFKPAKDIYWESHYNLGKISKSQNKLLGRQRFEDIVINVLIPFIYLYSTEYKDEIIKNNALLLFNNLKIKPDNSIIKLISEQLIKQRKIRIDSPAKEQAVIQLYNFYCIREKCRECKIGKNVLSEKGYEYKIIFY